MPSREEMIKFLESKSQAPAQAPTSAKPSREEMIKFLENKPAPTETEDPRSALQIVKDGLDIRNMPGNMVEGLKKVDEYTGAPIRKFVTETISGKTLDKAPTGAEQAKMLGATDKTYGEVYGVPRALGGGVSPADIYGFGLEMVQDPVTLASGAVKGVKAFLSGGTKLAEGTIARQAVKTAQKQAAGATAETTAKAAATVSGGAIEAEQSGKLFSVNTPTSLDELRSWNPKSGASDIPGKGRLNEIVSTVPDLETKPLKYHYDMMENPKSMKELKLQFENLPTKDAQKIASYNQQMVNESEKKIKETVAQLAGGEPRALTDAGYDFISTVKDKYNAEKEALGPLFQEIERRSANLKPTSSRDLAVGISENSKIGKLLVQDEATGRLALSKNTPRTGMSDSEHSILAKVIDDLNDGMTFKEIQNARAYLKKAVDPTNPSASAEIEKVRSIMLGQLEDMAHKQGPDVGEVFKSYAKNERARESVEKIIGGRIESLDSMYAANPDKVVSKVFSNPNYAKVVGEYVGPEKMQEMVAAYIQTGVNKSIDSAKGFNPSTLKTWLKTNSNFLKANADPAVVAKLNALADYGYYGKRFLDEVNPSGTAASLAAAIKPEGFLQKISSKGFVGALESETSGRVSTAIKQRQATQTLNEALGAEKMSYMPGVKAKLEQASNSVSKGFNKSMGAQAGSASMRSTNTNAGFNKSASEEEKKKGPERWANDGIEMILKHDQSDVDRGTLEKLKESKRGQSLLIEASTAKNKKAMENVLRKIRSASTQKGDE